jgi:phosphopantothenoylcysteine decarboxylase/phosphopantothenate--cysteine ligase
LYLVRGLQKLGAEVSFILGEGNTIESKLIPSAVTVVRSTSDMFEKIKEQLTNGSVQGLISVAAISDYQPVSTEGKISSRQEGLSMDLKPTIKIVRTIRSEFPSLYIGTYKAEVGISVDELISKATRFLHENQVNFVCANWVGKSDKGFATKTNEIFVIRDQHEVIELKGSKESIGSDLANIIAEEFEKRKES